MSPPPAPAGGARVLFSLLSAGFLKHFEPVVEELARRGHLVDVLVHGDTGLVGAEELAERLGGLPRVTVRRAAAERDGWQDLTLALRACEDYLQFLDPRYHETYRARAHVRTPAAFRRLATRGPLRSPRCREALRRLLALLEAVIPVSPAVARETAALAPDVALFSPYIGLSTVQPTWLHAAAAQGVPTAVCVGSWDHLTSKSRIRPMPDLVTVWNETQRREATELHGVPADRIAVTGAQLFDHWFDWTPTSRASLCARAGLDPDRPFLLYTCFSPFKEGPSEVEFVREWIGRLSSSGDPRLADCGVLVRPHPKRLAQWRDADLHELDGVAVWPRDGRFVVDRQSKADFFDSLHHSAGVVGLNTSAMIEAGIVGRRVHTILVPRYWESQEGTLHFRYLMEVGGGVLQVARSWEEHLDQLGATLAAGPDSGAANRAFVERFVRPHGLDRPATPRFADAVEALAARPRRPRRRRVVDPALRVALGPVARRVAARREQAEREAARRRAAKRAKAHKCAERAARA